MGGWGRHGLEGLSEGRLGRGPASEPADQFEVNQAWGQALRDGVGRIGKVFDQQVGDGICAVDEVKDFEGSPDVLKVPEWVVAAPVTLLAVEEQRAEADIDPDIGRNGEIAAVAEVAGNIEWQIASIQEVEENLQVFIGGEVI